MYTNDKEEIRVKLQICTDPMDVTDHYNGIVNIVTGQIAPESVNVDNAVAIGYKTYERISSNLARWLLCTMDEEGGYHGCKQEAC